MATTGHAVEILLNGVRDTAGAVVASGKARFYQPGTLVAQTVYSDSACTTGITQPLTLNAAGQYLYCYTLEPVRMIVKDSADSATVLDVPVANLVRHDSVYITHPSINGGAETTLESFLTTATTTLGTDFQYKESATATARNYSAWLGETHVSVKDFGAVGDGATDDTTAIQNAIDRTKVRGGGWVYFPLGTYKITSALAIGATSSYIGVKICGAGRGIAVIKNFSTTGNAITVNVGSAVDAKCVIRDISITADTTSSGAGIAVTNGERVAIQQVSIALHRTGVSAGSAGGTSIEDIVIESTDDNAAAAGIVVGTDGRVRDCEVVSGTTNGTGVTLGADARAEDCYVSKFATGVLQSGARSTCRGMTVRNATTGVSITGTGGATFRDGYVTTGTTGASLTGANAAITGSKVIAFTTGVSLGAASTVARDNVVTTCTTGISVGAFASCSAILNSLSSNTTDISVNASATLLQEFGNTYSTITDTTLVANNFTYGRGLNFGGRVTKATDTTTTCSFTPTPQTCQIYVCEATNAGALVSQTINATATTGLVDGQLFCVVLQRNSGGASAVPTWNAQYITTGSTVGGPNGYAMNWFYWRSATSKWVEIWSTISANGLGTLPF